MLLTHPTILSISIHGVEYRPDDGVFDMPDSAAAIAMAGFGFMEANSGWAKRAKAVAPPSAKAKPRSRKPKAKPHGEGIYLPVAGSYSFTPSFCAPQPYINYKLQDTSCKTETAAESASASCIYHISDRIWPYCTDSGSGEAVRPEPSSAPSNSVAWHGCQTGPSNGAYSPSRKKWYGVHRLRRECSEAPLGGERSRIYRNQSQAISLRGMGSRQARPQAHNFRPRVRGPTTCLVMRRVMEPAPRLCSPTDSLGRKAPG
ncbi:MAG: hypothetical protein LBC63_02730 [Holophagales bacterium]|jgi:hypothetical protein|nr:hypothetical protein [Holophagales bacterium]